jgi:hypothetical protein
MSASRPGVTLNERAIESLEFIRTTMARSAPFTAVPGLGGMAMGGIGIAAAAIGMRQTDDWMWLAVWFGAAAIAAPVGFLFMRAKARRHGLSLWSANGRRFAQGFAPPLVAGGVITAALVSESRFDLVPATWLLMYGAGVLAGSIASIPVLAWVGAAFMVLGAGAAATAGEWRDLWLGVGFGGLQVMFGFVIARHHGG